MVETTVEQIERYSCINSCGINFWKSAHSDLCFLKKHCSNAFVYTIFFIYFLPLLVLWFCILYSSCHIVQAFFVPKILHIYFSLSCMWLYLCSLKFLWDLWERSVTNASVQEPNDKLISACVLVHKECTVLRTRSKHTLSSSIGA